MTRLSMAYRHTYCACRSFHCSPHLQSPGYQKLNVTFYPRTGLGLELHFAFISATSRTVIRSFHSFAESKALTFLFSPTFSWLRSQAFPSMFSSGSQHRIRTHRLIHFRYQIWVHQVIDHCRTLTSCLNPLDFRRLFSVLQICPFDSVLPFLP